MMFRTSHFLTMLNASLAETALAGQPVPAHLVPTICGFLRFCATQCAEMEIRLAGSGVSGPSAHDGNVISLTAWLASKGRPAFTPPGNGAA